MSSESHERFHRDRETRGARRQRQTTAPSTEHARSANDVEPVALQRVAGNQAAGNAIKPSDAVQQGLQSPAEPLDADTRRAMEERFHEDFSDVRVHIGSRAAQSARAVDAAAFTVGRDVVFADGRYRPNDPVAKWILAHELAHVVQQRASDHPKSPLTVAKSSGAHEREAQRAAGAVTHGQGVTQLTAAAPQVARVTDEELAMKEEWHEKSPEERQKIMAAGPKLEYGAIKEGAYKAAIEGATALRKSLVARMRADAETMPPDMKEIALGEAEAVNDLLQIVFNFVFFVIGVIVGLGEGVVDLVKGLVNLLIVLLKLLGHWWDSVRKNDPKYVMDDVRAFQQFLNNFVPGLKVLIAEWTTKFSNAPQERQAAMVGEIVGQIIAFIATWEATVGKAGKAGTGTKGALELAPATAGARAPVGAGAKALEAAKLGGPAAPGLVIAQASSLQPKDKGGAQQPSGGAKTGGGGVAPKKPRPMRVEEPPVTVGPGARGFAIEDEHLASLGGYDPLPPAFKGIDGVAGDWKMVTENGKRIKVYTRPDAVSVKSTEVIDAAKLETKIRGDLEVLKGPYSHERAGVRVEGLGQRELHLLFEEGRSGYIGKETLAMLKRMQKEAGAVRFRWYVYVQGRKYPGPTFFRQFKQFADLL